MTIAIPVFIMLLGLVIYLVANGKPSQLGLECFWVGLLVTLFELAGHSALVLK